MQQFTLGRKMDNSYPSNRWVVLFTLMTAVVASLLLQSVWGGLEMAGGFFLCWALTREIDPLNDLSAFVAGGFFLLGILMYDGIMLSILLWLILMLRLISRICGKTPTLLDLGVLFGLSGYLAYTRDSSLYLFLLGLGLLFAYGRYGKELRWGIGTLLAAIVYLIVSFLLPMDLGLVFFLDYPWGLTSVLVQAVLSSILILALRKDRAASDDRGKLVVNRWIHLGRIFFSVSVLMLLLFETATLATYGLLYAVMAGVIFFRLYLNLRGKTSGR